MWKPLALTAKREEKVEVCMHTDFIVGVFSCIFIVQMHTVLQQFISQHMPFQKTLSLDAVQLVFLFFKNKSHFYLKRIKVQIWSHRTLTTSELHTSVLYHSICNALLYCWFIKTDLKLFNKIISASCNIFSCPIRKENAQDTAFELGHRLGYRGRNREALLKFLRSIPAEELTEKMNDYYLAMKTVG